VNVLVWWIAERLHWKDNGAKRTCHGSTKATASREKVRMFR
jgi:hypothetical protein